MALKSLLLPACAIVIGASPAAAQDGDIEASLETLRSLWLQGQFSEIAEAAGRAMVLIEQSECPMRSDAAIVAFMGGVAGHRHHTDLDSEYLFWVASQVDEQLSVLPEAARTVSDGLRGTPGEDVELDRLFIETPYRSETLPAGCAEPYLDIGLLRADPVDADHVFIAFEFQNRSAYSITRPISVHYAFPFEEGEAIGTEVINRRQWRSRGGGVGTLVMGPCDSYQTRGAMKVEICRENASTDN